MRTPRIEMLSPRSARLLAIAGIGLAAALTARAGAIALSRPDDFPPPMVALGVAEGAMFYVAALVLSRLPGQRGTAWLLYGAGVCWCLSWWAFRSAPELRLIHHVFGPAMWAFVGWAALRYPDDRLRSGGERLSIAALFCWLSGAHLATVVLLDESWWQPSQQSLLAGWPEWTGADAPYVVARWTYLTGWAILTIPFVVLAIRRARRLRATDRWLAAPPILAAVALGVSAMGLPWLSVLGDDSWIGTAVLKAPTHVLVLVPVTFMVSARRHRLLRLAVADLVVRLAESTSPTEVRAALRRTLRDPNLQVLFHQPGGDSYLNTSGHVVRRPNTPGTFCIDVTSTRGEPLAVIVTDTAVARLGDLVRATVSVSRLALENARLHASVQAQLDLVAAARRELAAAGMTERRRLERNLHDGIQQRLLAISLSLSGANRVPGEVPSDQLIENVRLALHAALRELRDVAHGVHPAVLSEAGLEVALTDVAERLPVPVTLQVPDQRFDPVLETTAYYLVCEALSNTVKHARATRAEVRVREQYDRVLVEVIDDGVGGADPRTGTGLAGVVDRVRQAGGDVDIDTRPGEGTRLAAWLPCA